MKVKTSITLSDTILETVGRLFAQSGFRSRSDFIERAIQDFIRKQTRAIRDKKDLEAINRRARTLNLEAEDVLDYQST